MAEVGVLNLTIKDNSSEAAGGLTQLAGALSAVKQSATGLKLSSVATQIERIGKVVSESLTDSVISRIGQLTEKLSGLQGMTGTINIRIGTSSLSKAQEAIEQSAQGLEKVKSTGQTAGNQLEDAWRRVGDAVSGAKEQHEEYAKIIQSGGSVDLNKQFDVSNLPMDKLGMKIGDVTDELSEMGQMARDATQFQIDTGTFDTVTSRIEETGEAMTSIILYEDNLKNSWDSMAEEMKGKAQEVQQEIQNVAQTPVGEMRVFSSMQEAADALGISVNAVEQKLNNTLKFLQNNTQTMPVYSSIEEAARMMGISLEQAKAMVYDVNREIQNSGDSSSAFIDSENKIDYATEEMGERIDLLREKVAILRQELGEGIESGDWGEKKIVNAKLQIEQLESRIQSMQDKINENISNGGNQNFTMEQTNAMAGQLKEIDLWEAKLRDAEQEYNRLVNELGADNVKTIKVGLDISNLREKVQEYRDMMNQANADVNSSTPQYSLAETNAMASNVKEVDLWKAKLAEAQQQYNELVNTLGKDNVKTVKLGLDISELQQKINDYNTGMEEARQNAFSLSAAWGSFKDKLSQTFPTLTTMVSKLGQIAKYRFLRAVLKQITSGISEGLENVYWYSKAIKGDFATSMDSAATSLQTMKNSIGASLTPVISALIPYLETVVSWFITAVNYVNQFFSLLSGSSTWTKAVATATTAYTDSTSKASDSTKDLLADWDELNVIQSTSSSSGSTATDYSKMFEEVSEFDSTITTLVDGIKETFGDVLTLVKRIATAILAWKVSTAFSGILGTLASFVAAGAIIGLVFDLSTMFDNNYIKTDEEGWLVADFLTTALGSYFSGKIISKVLGTGAGLLTAGITFAVSAASTFTAVGNAQNEAQKGMLTTLGFIEAGIGAALATAAFVAEGFSVASALAGGVLTIALVTAIAYTLEVKAQAAERAEEVARQAFAATGEGGGINAQAYITALQAEFDSITAGAKIVLNAHADVSGLESTLTEAATSIGGYTYQLFHGDGVLTEADANSFKTNWETIMTTMDTLGTKNYETILASLTQAMNSKSEELRASALEIRTTFIMLEQNISAENAEIYQKMQDLVSKIASGNFTDADLQEYEKYYRIYSAATETGFTQIETALRNGENIDFGDAEHAVENAKEFIKTVGESANAASAEVDEAYQAVVDSTNSKRRVEEAKAREGEITPEQLEERINMYSEVVDTAKKYADEQSQEIHDKMQEAYDTVFKQALSAEGSDTEAYWKEVLVPLMKEAKEAGYDFPQELVDAYTEGINTSFNGGEETLNSPEVLISRLLQNGILDADTISRAINASVDETFNQLGTQESDLQYLLTNFLFSHNNTGMTETEVEAKNLLNITGWDLLSKDLKQWWTNSLKNAFGDDVTKQVLQNLGVSDTVIEELMNGEGSGGVRLTSSQRNAIYNSFFDEVSAGLEANPIELAIQYEIDSVEGNVNEITEEAQKDIINTMSDVFGGLDADTIDKIHAAFGWDYQDILNMIDTSNMSDTEINELQETVNLLSDLTGLDLTMPELDPSGIVGAMNTAALAVTGKVKEMKESLLSMDGITTTWEDFYGQTHESKVKVTGVKITTAATGGFINSGDLVMANENGNFELMGKMGNQPVVANNQQIISGISSGVSSANGEVVSELRGLSTTVTKILQKEFSVNYKASSTAGRVNQQSANAYSRVTG